MPNDNNSRTFIPTFPGAPHFRLPFRSVFMPVVPCALDGTLSLLELIAKLEYVINQYHDAIEANHTDILALAEELETSLSDLREYIDAQDADTLELAKAYAEALRDALKIYVDQQDAATLASAKAYADALRDALKTYVDTQDAATLASAKAYADALRDALKTYVDTQDAATLAAAKTYADGLVSTLRAYVDAQLALKQDLLTFDDLPTTGSNNPVTSGGIFGAIQTALATAVNYTNSREQTIREDMTAMFYTVELASSQVTTLPAGITYSSINNAAVNGKLVRVHVVAENWWYYYTEPCRFFRADLDNGETSIIDIDAQGNARFDSFS